MIKVYSFRSTACYTSPWTKNRALRFSESWGGSGNGASHLASCPNYHFVVELAASSATIVWEWRSGMSGAAKIDSDRGAASLLRLLMPAVHFHLRISSEHSPPSSPRLSFPVFPPSIFLPRAQERKLDPRVGDKARGASIRGNPAGECDVAWDFPVTPTIKIIGIFWRDGNEEEQGCDDMTDWKQSFIDIIDRAATWSDSSICTWRHNPSIYPRDRRC